ERAPRLAVGDAEDPGGGLRVTAEVPRLAPHHPECVVDHLFGDVIAMSEAREEARHAAVIEVVEFLESPAVPLGDARDEIHLPCHRGRATISRLRHVLAARILERARWCPHQSKCPPVPRWFKTTLCRERPAVKSARRALPRT